MFRAEQRIPVGLVHPADYGFPATHLDHWIRLQCTLAKGHVCDAAAPASRSSMLEPRRAACKSVFVKYVTNMHALHSNAQV